MGNGTKPPSHLANLPQPPTMEIQHGISSEHRVKKEDPSTGPAAYGLSFARVVRIDYARGEVCLQIMTGERDLFEWSPIPNTCAAAGARHFIGAMPECGDVCVIGWLATKNKTPVVLTWVPAGLAGGLEWAPVQDFLPTEVDMNPKMLAHFEGIYGRTRHKAAPMRPGCICLSSSQGSDIHLDEGVLIASRRANEIRLRDADQAIIFRSLQQFHAMGGARVYAGMVQRDATYLPRRMFSDGINWAAGRQQDNAGNPLAPSQLGASPVGASSLTPHPVFFRSDLSRPFPDSGVEIKANVDPYSFLARGLFIGNDGFALDPSVSVSGAEYAGKPIFRVSIDPNPDNVSNPVNGVIGEESSEMDTLTEYRIELDHTWDGRLPVTEQTDGFDADRLPADSVQNSAVANAGPFLTWVLGSVVGNDAFSIRGRQVYGLPLTPRIFDDATVDPRMDSGIGFPVGDHAASLFQVQSPIEDPTRVPSMFVSTTKDGRVKGFLSGPQNDNSLELALNGGMRLQANGPLVFDAPNMVFNFRNGDPTNNYAAAITTETGAILIRGNAPTTQGSFSARVGTEDIQENNLPAVLVEAPSGNVHVKAGRFVNISGANGVQIVNTDTVQIVPKKLLEIFSDQTTFSGNTYKKTVQGREENIHGGPKNFSPRNAPLRETKFIGTPLTGHFGGDTDTYSMLLGNRDETIRFGSHTTTVNVGNITWSAGVGTVKMEAGVLALSSSVTVSAATINATSRFGNISMQALRVNGSATISASLSSRITTTVAGAFVQLNTNSGKVGGIVSGADRDPLTNLPLSTFRMGSATQRLGVVTS